MSKERKILVFSAVYNESAHLQETLVSVLGQSFKDFLFLISDNFSTDQTPTILDSISDERVIKVKPPQHLSAINHLSWLNDLINEEYSQFEYSIFIGGHDFWSENYLEVLHNEMNQNSNCILAYSDTFEISSTGIILKKYPINICTTGIMKPLRPIYILNGLTHNIIFGGLWRERIRKLVIEKDTVCAAFDHLQIARASLFGDVTHVQGTLMGLRRVHGAGKLDVYYEKHLRLKRSDTSKGIRDFKKQLAVALEIQAEAVSGFPFYEQKAILDCLRVAMFNTYVSRYIKLLSFFEGGLKEFFADSAVQKYVGQISSVADQLHGILSINPETVGIENHLTELGDARS